MMAQQKQEKECEQNCRNVPAAFVKIYSENGLYQKQSNNIGLDNLGELLKSAEWESSILNMIDDLYNDAVIATGNNVIAIEKDDNSVNIRADYYNKDKTDEDKKPYIRLKRDGLIEVLKKWHKFIQGKGKEFILTCEDGQFLQTKIIW
jgi:hypothetical protein